MTTNLCPYCRKFYFKMLDHVFECSKTYIDSHLLKLRDRRIGWRDRRATVIDRRQNFNTLYILGKKFGDMAHAGYYINASGCVETDRREARGLGRRNGPQRRQT